MLHTNSSQRQINSFWFQRFFSVLISHVFFFNCLGHLGAIRLLLLQNKLDMDAKNVFGFTPLMKAAIQGHIRCAKTLLFAGNIHLIESLASSIHILIDWLVKSTGSSPIEIDYKRQLRAEQWSRFCGRHSCAELIEKWSRTRNLDKMPFTNKDQNDGTVVGRARANSTTQTISPVTMAPIKTERGTVI